MDTTWTQTRCQLEASWWWRSAVTDVSTGCDMLLTPTWLRSAGVLGILGLSWIRSVESGGNAPLLTTGLKLVTIQFFFHLLLLNFVFVWIQMYTSYSKNVISSWTIPAEKQSKTDLNAFDSAKSVQLHRQKTQWKPVNQEYRMTCTSEWNAAPALITVAHRVPYHCYSSCPPWKKACRFPWRKFPSAVRRDTPDSASSSDSSTSASFVPLCFTAATGITAPKPFSQQRPSVVGKQVSKFLTTFQFIPCEKLHLPPCLLPCSTSFHLHHSFFPWLLLPLPSAQLILIVLTRFIRLWPGVMSVITCWFAPPPLLTVLPCLPLVHPLAALGQQRPF